MVSKLFHHIIFVLFFFMILDVNAEDRKIEDIRKIANNHWQNKTSLRKLQTKYVENFIISNISQDSIYFVVRKLSTNNDPLPGYILVSADTSMPEILAFDDNSSFCLDSLPLHIQTWLAKYKQMRTTSDLGNDNLNEWLLSSVSDLEDIPPLLGDIEWNQDFPYNALCPEMNGVKTPSGCVATALSQIMKYYNWPLHGKSTIDYYTSKNNFHISCDFENTNFNWEKTYSRYNENVHDDDVILPISTLLYAVGASVKMDYDTSGSGANDYNTYYGMKNYMDYDNDMFLADSKDFSSRLWHSTLQKELCENRPVYYTGQSGLNGHAFVIDGMKKGSNGIIYYHVNWGWGGLCNGYYLLNMLRPSEVGAGASSGSDFSNGNTMICGIIPEDNISHQRMICKDISVVSNSYYPDQLLQVCIERLVGMSDDITVNVSLLLCNKNISDEIYELYRSDNQHFNYNRKWIDYYISCNIPKDISPGEYELKLECVNEKKEIVELYAEFPSINILPLSDWYGGNDISPKECIGMCGKSSYVISNEDSKFSINVDSLVNLCNYSNNGQISFMITDTEGKLLSVMEEYTPIFISGSSVKRNTVISATLSKNIPDGYYWLCLGYRSSDNEYSYIYNMTYSKSLWMSNLTLFSIPFKVDNGIIYIEDNVIYGKDVPWSPTNTINIHLDKKSYPTYNLNGIKTTNPLPHGVYINNNKKYLKTK